MPEGATLMADKGYDSNAIREAAAGKNAWANPLTLQPQAALRILGLAFRDTTSSSILSIVSQSAR